MSRELADKLQETVDREGALLCHIPDEDAGRKPAPSKWSKKEELGHLIDSACNNHVRFVVASIGPEFRGAGYRQDDWVEEHGYNEMRWADVVDFWRRYNAFLAALVRRIPDARMETPCTVGEGKPVTLRFLIEDYILHMQHHLDHILERENITAYPGAAVGA